VSGVIPYLLEGHYTFAFKSMRAMTVAEMFVFIIAARSLLVWGYAGWAKQHGLFSVRMSLTRPDAAWCLAAAFVAIATAVIQSHFSGEPHHFTWVAFTRYWGVLPGIGDTILQYAYYVTEGFAIVWMVDAFQNAGEFAFPRLRFPWGAVGLMVTWGAGHYFSKDWRTAIYAVSISCIIGLLHFANRKDIWPSLIFWLLMPGGG
ncbi:MAG: hypothetical protein WAN76_11820, partial [Candidatus Sulfotelmatobacter sp.]